MLLITEICAGLQTILSQNDAAGGDPIAFADHISFLSMMNEKRGDAEDSFRKVRDALEAFAPGTVIIFGPADTDLWWPDCVGAASSATWMRRSFAYFDALTEGGKILILEGLHPLVNWICDPGCQRMVSNVTIIISKIRQAMLSR